MKRLYITIVCLCLVLVAIMGQEHTKLASLSLELSPEELAEALKEKGMHPLPPNSYQPQYQLTGRVSGINVMFNIYGDKDTLSTSCVMITTVPQQSHLSSPRTDTSRNDFKVLCQWLHRHYGKPHWEGMVRSHPFARWYVGFDRDIVIIATATPSVEIWFYDNHKRRNIDYYSILKYCERYPAEGLPQMTAQEQVTWKSTAPPAVSKKHVGRHHRKGVRRHSGRAHRAKHGAKGRKHRRRR